jgi:uncharacterized membrane protein YphA (DoxX/SURF4 family)
MVLKEAKWVNHIFLGLVMVVPGLMKLFIMGPAMITEMLTGLGFPAASLFAWLLILSEIGFGAAILAKWKLEYTRIPPMIILVVAGLTMHIASVPLVLLHIGMAANYFVFGQEHKK